MGQKLTIGGQADFVGSSKEISLVRTANWWLITSDKAASRL
jgi:hypothetical protein